MPREAALPWGKTTTETLSSVETQEAGVAGDGWSEKARRSWAGECFLMLLGFSVRVLYQVHELNLQRSCESLHLAKASVRQLYTLLLCENKVCLLAQSSCVPFSPQFTGVRVRESGGLALRDSVTEAAPQVETPGPSLLGEALLSKYKMTSQFQI